MMVRLLFICFFFLLATLNLQAQAPVVQQAVYSDVSIPLRDMIPVERTQTEKTEMEEGHVVPNKFRPVPPGFTPDGAIQSVYNDSPNATTYSPLVNFNGASNASNPSQVTPPDPAGDVGPNHYVQVVNSLLQIFNKNGSSLYGPVITSTLWNGFNGNWTDHNDGDAIVLYDETADRWIISQFAVDCTGTPFTEYELIAVSTSGDPTGSYYRYAFLFDYMPDYPKLGVWQDGYYMAVNRFNTNTTGAFKGVGACVMQRSKMLTGDPTASMIYFKTETLGGSGSAAGSACWAMLPSDCDGTLPTAGTPNYFVYIPSTASTNLRIWALHTDWATPASSTFTYVTALTVAGYTQMGSGSVPEQGSLALDGLGDRLMFRNQYRNFGSYETFVTCHSVNTGSSVAGIRWYEYRKTGSTFSLYQQSTYAPGDGKSRWMGSIAMNASGDIGLAYSVSSSTMYPSIYFTGRKAGDVLNQMTITEGLIHTGTVSMTSYSRWGDYSALNVDPSDNTTFWTTQEYVGTYGGWCPWATKIASFKFINSPVVVTQSAAPTGATTANLSGTINPNGLSSTYHFDWGTTTGYGNSTPAVSAGSGTANVNANAGITGAVAGTTYHFRIVGVNSGGMSNGGDQTFIAGGATVSTASVTSILPGSATCGGNVTSDGGVAVTERGVCYGTTVNPTTADSHTSDGSGTGTFVSNLTGLPYGVSYHARGYATNAAGTTYGSDVPFTTGCGSYGLLFTQNFQGLYTLPSCWSLIDNGVYGQNWKIGAITAYTSLNPALSANYAYLNSDEYGSGYNQNADLITPTLDLLNCSTVVLKFNHYFRAYTGSLGTLSVSINNGSTWTTIQTFTATSATNPVAFSQTITAAANQTQVKFKWNYTGTYGYYWAIDDIRVTTPGMWLGGAPGTPLEWNTAANWESGTVPTASTDVFIPEQSSLPVISTSGATCNNLYILSGGRLTINPAFKLTVNGITKIY